jgi:hypothetical protein
LILALALSCSSKSDDGAATDVGDDDKSEHDAGLPRSSVGDAGAAGSQAAAPDDTDEVDAGSEQEAGVGDAGAGPAEEAGSVVITREGDPTLELEGLEFEGASSGPYPELGTGARHFAVKARSSSELSVIATAAKGISLTIDGEPAESGEALELPDVSVGSTIEILLDGEDGDWGRYSVIVLPTSFPQTTALVREKSASKDPIYVNLTNRDLMAFFVAKLDSYGIPTFFIQEERACFDFKKHPGGLMSYAANREDRPTGADQVILNERGKEIDRVRIVDRVNTDIHDFHILPNGEYMIVGYEWATRDLRPYGGGNNTDIEEGILQRVSPDLEVLFEWNSFEYLRFDESIYGKSDTDYAHLNSMVLDDDGDWIVSSRGLSQVFKIDGVSGEVQWRMGGISNEFEFIDDPYEGICGQHTASLVEGGNLLIFDNGQYCAPGTPERVELTRAVEYAIDEEELTATLVWSFDRPDLYTTSQGSAQRLPNGHTMIGWGNAGDILATEVDESGEIVFDLQVSDDFTTYRAMRFPD